MPSKTPGDAMAARRVLLVEDDDDLGRAMSRLIERPGVEVQRARTGTEAVAMLGSIGPVDAAVVDLVLPGVGGLEVIHHLRQAFPGCRIVAVTGMGGQAIEQALRSAGADEFLLKPVAPAALLAAVGATPP